MRFVFFQLVFKLIFCGIFLQILLTSAMDSIPGGSTSRRDDDGEISSRTDFVSEGSTETEISLSRRTIISYYRQCTSTKDSDKMQYLCEEVKGALNIEVSSEIRSTLSKLVYTYKQKLVKSHRNFDRCLNNNKDWFNAFVTFVVPRKRKSGSLGGRPKKEFDECSERSKRQKTRDIRNQFTSSELSYAAQMNLRAVGELEKSKTIKATISEKCDLKKLPQCGHGTHSPEKALSLLIEGELTKHQYNLFRSTALEANCKLYPNYETVTDAKKRCYPSGMLFTEATAEVPLQNLLDHTVERLLLSLNEVIASLDDNKKKKLCLISKWGCDGSGSHSQYKQKFEEADLTDQFMFITSIVPIRLFYQDEDKMELVWQNPRPSSPRYCRPLKLQMAQETSALTLLQAENVKNEISLLTPTNGDNYTVRHDLKLTMVDGKVVNAITGTKSAMRCYLCGLTSKDFNRIKHSITRPVKKENLEYGISTLHAWIRFADCILHLAYKMKLCKWRSRKENESIIEAEKKRIQKDFWEKLGLHVDEPRQGGGTSTDGNTARKIFQNARVTAEITGFNLNIIERFHTVLKVISSGYKIKTETFKDFCLQTAAAYIFNYPWYPMPTTVHKILIHGPEIVDSMNVAIGLLGEDAQESRNKDIRNFREHFSRKFSRTICMTDTFQRLMVSSDPFITGLRKLTPKKESTFTTLDLSLLDEETEI